MEVLDKENAEKPTVRGPNPRVEEVLLSPEQLSQLAHLSSAEIALAISVLVFFAGTIAIESWLAYKTKIDSITYFRLLGLTVVVNASVFLVVAGYTTAQITPVVGLLATVAGYILGKSDSSK